MADFIELSIQDPVPAGPPEAARFDTSVKPSTRAGERKPQLRQWHVHSHIKGLPSALSKLFANSGKPLDLRLFTSYQANRLCRVMLSPYLGNRYRRKLLLGPICSEKEC
jgi:hypothetical protein